MITTVFSLALVLRTPFTPENAIINAYPLSTLQRRHQGNFLSLDHFKEGTNIKLNNLGQLNKGKHNMIFAARKHNTMFPARV
jgi:hypothetical protein